MVRKNSSNEELKKEKRAEWQKTMTKEIEIEKEIELPGKSG